MRWGGREVGVVLGEAGIHKPHQNTLYEIFKTP